MFIVSTKNCTDCFQKAKEKFGQGKNSDKGTATSYANIVGKATRGNARNSNSNLNSSNIKNVNISTSIGQNSDSNGDTKMENFLTRLLETQNAILRLLVQKTDNQNARQS